MKQFKAYFPILNWLPAYRRNMLAGDLGAGFTVGVVLIPQGMAYALIAGLPPVYGLYASIVPQLIYAIFGTSRQLSVAPVAMDSLLVASGISVMAAEGSDAYITYAILLALFMGLTQFVLGLVRMGFITNLLSKPVISGFTSAAAIIIGLNQLKYLLGVDLARAAEIHKILIGLTERLSDIHLPTLLIGLTGIALMILIKRKAKNIPAAFVAVVLAILAVQFFRLDEAGVSIVREVPRGLPSMITPDFSIETIRTLAPLALTIAVVAFMEAFSVAKAIEGKRRDHQVMPNQELIALGLANTIGSFFQSYPVTGGFSRSAVNDQAGANTPIASIVSALLVGLTLLFLTPLFYNLPHAILASIIMVAVSGLIDLKYFYTLLRTNKVEWALLLATAIVTLVFGMVPGIISGISLSILILLFKAANPHIAVLGRMKDFSEYRNVERFKDLTTWPNLLIVRADVPFVFVNIQVVKDRILAEAFNRKQTPEYLILDCGSVSHVDATGIIGLIDLIKSLEEKNIKLIFAELIGPVRDAFYRNGIISGDEVDRIFLTTDDAVQYCTLQRVQEKRSAMARQTNV